MEFLRTFMLLKDAAGLVKLYALVSVQDHQFVGIGETLEAVRKELRKEFDNKYEYYEFCEQNGGKRKTGNNWQNLH